MLGLSAPACAFTGGGYGIVAGPHGCLTETPTKRQGPLTHDCVSLPVGVDVSDVAVAPDGRWVYVASPGAGAVVGVRRSSASGELFPANVRASGLPHATWVRMSPDGRRLYVSSVDPATPTTSAPSTSTPISVLARDPNTGAIARMPGPGGCVSGDGSDGRTAGACRTADGLSSPGPLVASRDGRFGYAVDGTGGIHAFVVGPDGLSPIGAPFRLAGASAQALAAGPQGVMYALFVHGGDDDSNAVVRLTIANDGSLQTSGQPNDCIGSGSWSFPCRVDRLVVGGFEIATDGQGQRIFATANYAAAAVELRYGDDGLGRVGCIGITGLTHACAATSVMAYYAGSITVSPDGRRLFLAGGDVNQGIEIYDRRRALFHPFDCVQGSYWLADGFDIGCGATAPAAMVDLVRLVPHSQQAIGVGEGLVAFAPALGLPDQRLVATGGRVRVKVACPTAHCTGTLRLVTTGDPNGTDGETLVGLGATRFARRHAGPITITIPLRASGARRLAHRGTLVARVEARLNAAGSVRSSGRTLRLRNGNGAASPLRPPRRCDGFGGYSIVARSKAAVVFKALGPQGGLDAYACLSRGRAPVRLATSDDYGDGDTLVRPVALAGRYVAFSDHFLDDTGPDGELDFNVKVVDLRTGKQVSIVCVDNAERGGDCSSADADSLALSPNGNVAYGYTVTTGSGKTQGVVAELAVNDAHAIVLARGAGVRSRSLTWSGGFVHWRDARGDQRARMR